MSFFHRHSEAIEAASAFVTALVAIAALIGVGIQLQEADRVARAQTARDAYRNHLALAVASPEFAGPKLTAACTLLQSDKGPSYRAFVDHMLYAAEQMLAIEDGWEDSFESEMIQHRGYLCQPDAPSGDTPEVAALLARFRGDGCEAVPVCLAAP